MTGLVVVNDIDTQAALWAVRYERGLDTAETAALERWLAEDARHLGAYARARAIALDSARLSALGQEAANAPGQNIRFEMQASRRSAIAAATVMFVGVAGTGAALLRKGQSYQTGLGEIREVVLEDGTVLTLSALSSASVRMGNRGREVVIAAGEALLDVASFAAPLRILTAGTTVEVETGRVLVRRYAQDPLSIIALDQALSVDGPEGRVVLDAGERLALARQPVLGNVDAADVERSLAWLDGQLALHDDYLRTASSSFARFSPIALEFDGPQTANMRITGLFDLRDPVSFARAAALSLGLRVRVEERLVRLYKN